MDCWFSRIFLLSQHTLGNTSSGHYARHRGVLLVYSAMTPTMHSLLQMLSWSSQPSLHSWKSIGDFKFYVEARLFSPNEAALFPDEQFAPSLRVHPFLNPVH